MSLFNTEGKIDSFSGDYRFLSNFYVSPMKVGDYMVDTVEHEYQAQKTSDPDERHYIRTSPTPGRAKRLGQKCSMREDWDKVKIDVMYHLLLTKFSDVNMQSKLLETGNMHLVEGNTWDDTFWGVCNGVGKNWLGILLMRIREEIRDGTFGERY